MAIEKFYQLFFAIISFFFFFQVKANGDLIGDRAFSGNHPALIPLPQYIQWTSDKFPLPTCKWIIAESKEQFVEAGNLQTILARKGIKVSLKIGLYNNEAGAIVLRKGKKSDTTLEKNKEGYRISVNNNIVLLTANTSHGTFNSIQTLKQLIADRDFVPGCEISDYPAYEWRGYMIDVARNYQSMELIKQQIDIMAAYKLNVFHFHVTDDIAWRLQIKKYPQLTSPEFMERNKGQYYSIAQIKELISYCRDRYITFVPEIDMPGHSKAFSRAIGTDMQSERGLKVVKEIVQEICVAYNVPYIHIGADEVRITNRQFIPEITGLIRKHNKKVIGWFPGGNFDQNVIRQWWDGQLNDSLKGTSKFIDSWYLYLNHMDPESSVINILNKQIGNQATNDSSFLGGEICLWPDRRIQNEQDVLWQNPVYPGMLAFSERCWRGGGYPGQVSDIGPDSSVRAKEFTLFEKRLIDHKSLYFQNLPFPYVKQSHIRWKLLGPFNNQGNLDATFWPEKEKASPADSVASLHVSGATIWLRHFWPNDITAWLADPRENTSWYAYTSFKSESDTTLDFWIGFKDISRSHADAAPPQGSWDYQQSKVWLNNQAVPPPKWANSGEKGSLETALVDEGFAYRTPVKLRVKKGWNKILVKCPVGSFKEENGNEYVKWMFTLVPVKKEKGINWYSNDVIFCTDCK